MPKTNKTDFALLGILNTAPMSGYDIRSYIQQSIGFFWQESYGQIYPGLKRLHTKKLVTKKKAKESKGPTRFVYSITKRGQAELAKWLAAEPDPEPIRHEHLLKLFFGSMGEPKDQVRHLEVLLIDQRDRLEQFKTVERDLLRQYTDHPNHPYWCSTLRYGQLLTAARVTWCEETLAWLNNRKQDTH